MKKRLILMAWLGLFVMTVVAQDRYITKTGTISFYSHTPVEDIHAENNQVSSILDMQTGELVFAVLIRSFKFKKSLMEEHFNENYMDSEKYPKSQFKGQIEDFDKLDLSNPGSREVKVKGELTIRDETKTIEVTATLQKMEGDKISGKSVFDIDLDDYGIEIPNVVKEKIAKSIEVTCDFVYEPYKR